MQYLQLKHGLWLVLLLTLSACSHWRSGQTRFAEYAQTLPPIVVPSGIKNPTEASYYPVPPVAMRAPLGTTPPLTPPGSHLTPYKQAQLPPPK